MALILAGCVSDAAQPRAALTPCEARLQAAMSPYLDPQRRDFAFQLYKAQCMGGANPTTRNAAGGDPNLLNPNGMTSIPDPDLRP